MDVIEALPEFDKPSYFGLPENIERSTQRMVSQQVISQLKILQRSDAQASKFDKEVWASELGPILNLWKKVNQVCCDVLDTPEFDFCNSLFFLQNFLSLMKF